MTEQQELLAYCSTCGVPADECPTTFKDWRTQLTNIDELTDPSCQGYVRCPSSPDCPGHLVERKLFCTACQEKGKTDEARPDSRPNAES